MKSIIYKKFYVLLLFFISLSSCSNEYESLHEELIFIGDSIIKGWDTDKYFNSQVYRTINYGVNGSRLDDLPERHDKLLTDKNIVVIIGTNDIFDINSETSYEFYTQNMFQFLKVSTQNIYIYSPSFLEITITANPQSMIE